VASGVLSALIARETTGRGQHVSTSLLQGAWLYTTQLWQDIEKADASVHAVMAKTYPPGVHQTMIFECADREFVHVSVMSGLQPTKTLDEIVGVTPVPDPELEGVIVMDAAARRNARLREAFKRRKRDELIAEMIANNIAAEAVVEPEEQFAHPQLVANQMVATVDDPDLGPTTQIGVPVHLFGTPGAIAGPQPRVGEHNDEIWGALGYTSGAVAGGAA
ncbi:MAG TPA: CoA transferase, partial [Acidimicrobiia bacterium]|nr:CoA transferase [Acidimicrobiia bacterium]